MTILSKWTTTVNNNKIPIRVAALSAERYCGGELHIDFIFITTCCMDLDAHTAAYCIPLYSSEDFYYARLRIGIYNHSHLGVC